MQATPASKAPCPSRWGESAENHGARSVAVSIRRDQPVRPSRPGAPEAGLGRLVLCNIACHQNCSDSCVDAFLDRLWKLAQRSVTSGGRYDNSPQRESGRPGGGSEGSDGARQRYLARGSWKRPSERLRGAGRAQEPMANQNARHRARRPPDLPGSTVPAQADRVRRPGAAPVPAPRDGRE